MVDHGGVVSEEYWDDNGYPTEEVLAKIKTWDVVNVGDYLALMEFCKELWAYRNLSIVVQDNVCYRFATVGWSGNEDIIGALQENSIFWMMYWAVSERGGLYVFCPMSYVYDHYGLKTIKQYQEPPAVE